MLQNLWASIIACSLLSTVILIIVAAMIRTNWANDCFTRLFAKTFHDTAIEAAVDLVNGAIIKAYPRGKDYYYVGDFKTQDEKYLVLWSPEKWNIQDGSVLYSQEENDQAFMLLKLEDLECIEVLNNPKKQD